MKKKIVSGIISMLVLFSAGLPIANSFTVFAKEYSEYYEYNDELAGITFKSFDDMADLVNSLDEKLTDVEPEVAEYLLETDGIYLPTGYNEDDIFDITVDPTRVMVSVCNDTEDFVLHYYHSTKAGKSQYDCYKDEEKLNNGTTDIYTYDHGILNSYVWESDGKYFMLDDYTKSEDTIYTLCTAHKILFDKGNEESSGLTNINGKIYYINSDGSYYTGWKTIGQNEYYFKKNGEAATKNITIGNVKYKFNSDGICKGLFKGWTKKSGKYYYYKDGKMLKSCWLNLNGKKTYYLRKDGSRAVGKLKIGGKTYTFDKNGKLVDE